MLSFTFMHKNARRALVVACTVLFLAGCPSLPQGTNDEQARSPSYYYIYQANDTYGSAKADWQLLAVRALLREKNLPNAVEYLKSIADDLNHKQSQERLLITAELEVAQRKPSNALATLAKVAIQQLSNTQRIRYYQIQADAAQKGNTLLQIRSYVTLEQLVNNNQRQEIIDATWNALVQIKPNTLNSLVINANEETLRGWLDLLRVYQAGSQNVSQLPAEIKAWQIRYSDNPAAKMLPSQLMGMLKFEPLNTSNIALVLPFDVQGKQFSDPIMAGFAAAMDDSNAAGVRFNVYDSSSQPIAELLQRIQNEGYTLVVGPLLKNTVQEAINTPTKLNILALNNPDNIVNHSNVCYFGLSPEDEARQAAQYILKQNRNMPLIIAPQSDYGIRTAKAFDQEWEKIGGQGALVQYFHSAADLKEAINSGSGITLTGSPVTPGHAIPNLNIDSVYIVATQAELTLIKARLDMASSSRSPTVIYASSRSNQAGVGPDFRIEMDGLKFSDIPLLAGANPRLYQQAMKIFNGDYSKIRLYAMGVDAWTLANNFAQLRQLPDYQIGGMTGQLRSDNNCVVGRQLAWLEYRQGRIVLAQ